MINRNLLVRKDKNYNTDYINLYVKTVTIFLHKPVESVAVYYVEIILKTNNSEYKYLQTFTNIYYFNFCFNKCLSKSIVIKLLNTIITRDIVFIPKFNNELAVYNTDIIYTIEYNL